MCVTKSSIQTETVSVFQLAKKHGVQQFQSSATNSSGDGAITSWGVSPFEYHLLFKLKFFFSDYLLWTFFKSLDIFVVYF